MTNIIKAFSKDIMGVVAKKVNSEPGDGHTNNANCIIIAESADTPYGIVYLAIFEDYPLPIAIADFRIKLLINEKKVKVQLTDDQQDYLSIFPQKMFKFYDDEQQEKEVKNDQNQEKS